ESVIFTNVGGGADTLLGGRGNDVFHMTVDRMVDHINGGAGEDTIDYSASDYQLNIDLSSGNVSANFGKADVAHYATVAQVTNVEDVIGSQYDDTVTGSSGDNRIDGGAGNDIIHAGDGNDTLIGGMGYNILDGGKGIDTVDYSSADLGVVADL